MIYESCMNTIFTILQKVHAKVDLLNILICHHQHMTEAHVCIGNMIKYWYIGHSDIWLNYLQCKAPQAATLM
jgi:hypothetical protein